MNRMSVLNENTSLRAHIRCCHLVTNVPRDVQVPLTANHGLVEAPQHLQCVAKVSTSFGFSQQVTDCPAQGTAGQLQHNNNPLAELGGLLCVTLSV